MGSEGGVFSLLVDVLEVVGTDLKFVENFELRQRGKLRNLSCADFVEDYLEHPSASCIRCDSQMKTLI